MRRNTSWAKFMAHLETDSLLPGAMHHAASGLSEMIGRPITIDVPRVERLPISQVSTYIGGPETEMVGIYLLIEGDMPGQAILMLPLEDALHMVDLLMDVPPGTTDTLGELERSALAEAGNLTASFFLNEVALFTGVSSRPSPPAVMVDMLGAILSVVAAPVAVDSNELLIVETVFKEPTRIVQAHFWILPYPCIPILEHTHHN
jgi:chemotaxis protein CheC